MNISLLGAPGCGKGTQAKKICEYYGIAHISTGDLFRRAISNNTALGKKIAKYMSKLVPDDIVIDLVKERISEPDCANGYVLDGFPRTINQAELFLKDNQLDHVIYLEVDNDVVVDRIKSRRTCQNCGEIYNTKTYNKNTCSKCGGALVVRTEDSKIDERMETYLTQTYPLVDYFDKKGLLRTIKGNDKNNKNPQKEINKTFDRIKEYLGEVND